MQVLVFNLGDQEYALPTCHVVRVLPVMTLTRLAPAADFIAGVMNYHGSPVPVIDLARIGGMPSAAQRTGVADAETAASFDTRIVLVNHEAATGSPRLLGLLAEHVSGVRQVDAAKLSDSGVRDPHAPFLGQVLTQQPRLLQLIELTHLVPPHVCAWLFDASATQDPAAQMLPAGPDGRIGGSGALRP